MFAGDIFVAAGVADAWVSPLGMHLDEMYVKLNGEMV
jgi:hypothetical protein